ncbi:acyltransferase family protein [Parabacteroides pacaensis]|uniref:acyltransferase family protein n=1 Tax=Parabacteroides pacaensis TaxID=2086575 RepID=UPI000D111D35|nr:DUF5009 domain-containing protein [Parabacteroides pacaensis]
MKNRITQRLESLDVLRGFDLFCLVALESTLHPLARALDVPWFHSFMWGFTHVDWVGFSTWDLVMPLFLFMAGVSMPFAFSRFRENPDKGAVYRRILKRVVLLWIFGMMCQGNLLTLQVPLLHFYSNTLQSIAIGYLFSALLFLHVNPKIQISISVALLLIYWAGMTFIRIDGFGGGDFTPERNLAEGIDQKILGPWRDGVSWNEDGTWQFASWYRYTWIWSSLNFVVTVMTGVFAGQILKGTYSQVKKIKLLLGIGTLMVVAGWLWGFQMPVIKKLWTSSMVLVSSGYCFWLMGLFYYWIDYKNHRKGLTWLKVYGMNSIVAYLLANLINFSCIGNSLFFGLEQYIGKFYPFFIAVCNVSIIYVILYLLYKHKLFLKV